MTGPFTAVYTAPLVCTEASLTELARDGYIRPSYIVENSEPPVAHYFVGTSARSCQLGVPLCTDCEAPLDAGVCTGCELVFVNVEATGDGWFQVAA